MDSPAQLEVTEIPAVDGVNAAAAPTSRRSRARKRKHREIEDAAVNSDTVPEAKPAEEREENVGRRRKKSKRDNQDIQDKQDKPGQASWKVSEPTGGLFADLLPIFSADEEYLLLGQTQSVKIYATATSMLARTCKTGGIDIFSFCLSARDPEKLYMLLKDGKVQYWDWTTAQKLKTWDLGAQVSDIAVSTLVDGSEAFDVLFTSETRKGQSSITAHYLTRRDDMAAKVLYQQSEPIRAIKTLGQANYIVAVTWKSVIVGIRINAESKKIKQLQYVFNKFEVSESITCFAARINLAETSKKTAKGGVDVAIGLEDGMIRVFYDAAATDDKQKHHHITPTNTKLHWHRHAVGSVGWASDGNYVISGGRETVLVLWQLDTNTQTKIPHLTSAIESIAISPRGVSYSIRLADNSVMIIGTQDFIPTFHVAGVGFPSTKHHGDQSLLQYLPQRRTPVTSISTQLPKLVSAVPTDIYRERHEQKQKSGFYTNTGLQSTPLSSISTSVTKQALVENYSTTFRQRPDGKQLIAPNVVLLEADHSGSWLATVDEWYQPLDDLLSNSVSSTEAKISQLATVVTNLVFWAWNKETSAWERSTRIPNPHVDENDASLPNSLVLDLVAAPASASFWTLGSDSTIKHWLPREKETLGARATTTANKDTASIWRCTRSIHVPYTTPCKGKHSAAISSARLAISKDGSVFAVSRMSSTGSEVTIFTLQAKEPPKRVFTYNLKHEGVSVAFLNQYLIIADCESVIVRDLTNSTKWYNAALGAASAADLSTSPHIAMDHEHQLFAVSVPRKLKRTTTKSRKSRIRIFSTLSKAPIFSLDNQPHSAALLSVPSLNKFYVLTTEAEIYSISPGLNENLNTNESLTGSKSEDEVILEDKRSNTLSNIFGTLGSTQAQIEDKDASIDRNELRKKIEWNDIPGLNLDQPFALPKTSAIQQLSALAIGA